MDARRILKGHVADEPRLLLVIQEERAVSNAADQMAALVGLEVAQRGGKGSDLDGGVKVVE